MNLLSIREICERIGGSLEGAADVMIHGVEQIDRASDGQLTLIGSRQYAEKWRDSGAAAAIVQADLVVPGPQNGRPLIRVADPDLALAAVLELFAPPSPLPPAGVHSQAVVDPTAALGSDVRIGPMCVVGAGTTIGDGTVLHPNVTILSECTIGRACTFWPGVVIRERCIIGDGCILHPGVAIGGDGFGYRPSADGLSLVKIPHIGIVRLGRDVELGSGTCVDRGKFSETSIGDGTKIDNLCQIGHNCRIGRSVVIAGLSGLGGSVVIGDGAMLGGGSIIKDHVTIGPGAKLGGHSGLMHDIPPGETWHGHPAHDARAAFREFAAIRRLPELLRELKRPRD